MEECARVASQLRQQGLHLSDDFIRAAIAEGTSSEDSTKAVYEKSLHCDFNICATGCLPSTIDTWNKRVLDGRTVLQVDEVTDTAASAKQRYDESRGGPRCLKLYMTDGKLHICGFEQQHVPDLGPLMQAGFKVELTNILVRHGLLALTPNTVRFLGGKVDRLEAARQRAVERWKQPVACNSGNVENGDTRAFLYRKATAAAWTVDASSTAVPGHARVDARQVQSASTAQEPLQATDQMQARPRTQLRQQSAPQPAASSAQVHLSGAPAALNVDPSPHSSLQGTRQGASSGPADHGHEHLGNGTQAARNPQNQPSSSAGGGDNTARSRAAAAEEWDPADSDQDWDAVDEHPVLEEEVVVLSGDDDESLDIINTPGGSMQQPRSLAGRAHASPPSCTSDQEAATTSLSQLAAMEGVTYPVRLTTFAGVTALDSNLAFMDEKQNALKHFTMIVEIEERVGGAIYKASVHHDVLQHLLGAEPGKMRDCLVQGEKEAVRARIAHLKHFVITFTGEMNLLIYESHAQPVICSFAGTEDHQYKDTYQNTTAL